MTNTADVKEPMTIDSNLNWGLPMPLTPAERQHRRRARLPRRIDYYPSAEVRAIIDEELTKIIQKNGGHLSVDSTYASFLNRMILLAYKAFKKQK